MKTGMAETEISSSGAAEGGGDGAVVVDGVEEEEATKTAGWKMEGPGTTTTTIAEMPDEILLKVLSLLFGMTLMRSAPQVCKRWRKLCPSIKNVHLDFSWWGEKDEWGRFNGKKVPLEVLAGWLQKMQTASIVDGGGGGGGAASAGGAGGGWTSGMCEVFPCTTSVTMGYGQGAKDAHVIMLANTCPGLTYANFSMCGSLTTAALLSLADRCPGMNHSNSKHANFTGCYNLTDAAVLALADKCRGLEHANFGACENLTDAALLALADKCRGLKHADFLLCRQLTPATKAAVREQLPNCTFQF